MHLQMMYKIINNFTHWLFDSDSLFLEIRLL